MNKLSRAAAIVLTILLLALSPATTCAGSEAYIINVGDGENIMIDRDGNILVNVGEYDRVDAMYYGGSYEDDFFNACLYDVEAQTELVGLMDASGRLITEMKYSYITRMSEDLFEVWIEDMIGIINAQGEIVLPVEFYEAVSDGESGYYVLRDSFIDDGRGINSHKLYQIDDRGEERDTGVTIASYTELYDYVDLGFFIRRSEESKLYGFMDIDGKWIVEPEFIDKPYFDARGLAVTSQQAEGDKCYGLINTAGEWVVEPIYSYLYTSFPEHILAVSEDAVSITIIDKDTFTPLSQIPCDNTNIYISCDAVSGVFLLSVDDKMSLYDLSGELLFTAEEGVQIVLRGYLHKCIIMGSDGAWYIRNLADDTTFGPYLSRPYMIFSGETRTLYGFSEPITSSGSTLNMFRYGVIDHRGNIVIEPKYDSISYMGGDRLLAHTTEAIIMLDLEGNTIRTFSRYDRLLD